MDRLILTDDVLLQPLLQPGQALVLTFLDLAGGDLGPQLDDVGQVVHGQLGVSLFQQAFSSVLSWASLLFRKAIRS